MSVCILLQDVSKSFPGAVTALDCVNLAIRTGEWVAVTGASGSGKSTLLNLVGCLDRTTTGRVSIDGVDTSRLTEVQLAEVRREKVGLVFQQFHLVPYLTAVENVMLAQYFHSMPDETEAREALTRVGLGSRSEHLPSQLSGGEQQRVCIARALINRPKILLADEPTANLDRGSERRVLDIFQGVHQQHGTILMVTHDPEVARRADRQIVLEHGCVLGETDGEVAATKSLARKCG